MIPRKGVCPKCGSGSIRYDNYTPYAQQGAVFESMWYDCTCEDCGTEFEEHYNILFNEQMITTKGD